MHLRKLRRMGPRIRNRRFFERRWGDPQARFLGGRGAARLGCRARTVLPRNGVLIYFNIKFIHVFHNYFFTFEKNAETSINSNIKDITPG